MPQPKNYIQRLQAENKALRECIDHMASEIQLFRLHLTLDKFKGMESDGSRKDWISTGDVDARLRVILDEMTDDLHEIGE